MPHGLPRQRGCPITTAPAELPTVWIQPIETPAAAATWRRLTPSMPHRASLPFVPESWREAALTSFVAYMQQLSSCRANPQMLHHDRHHGNSNRNGREAPGIDSVPKC